jgi:hypothetical protein
LTIAATRRPTSSSGRQWRAISAEDFFAPIAGPKSMTSR